MKKYIGILYLFLCTTFAVCQQKKSNDELLVPVYKLPELLLCNNGQKVINVDQWEKNRRPELLKIFASEMYGKTPTERIHVEYDIISVNTKDINGKATSKQVKFTFSNNGKKVEAILLLYIPNQIKGKVPVFVGYNFKGNHSTTLDTTILYSPIFHLIKAPDHPDWQRGIQMDRWCYEKIIDRGYAVATMCYHDIFPDKIGLKEHSIASLFSDYNPQSKVPDEWQAIGVWAWGSSRIVDYLEFEEESIDTDKIAIVGHSRQGKAALWAGAQDTRFRVVISNNSGAGGAALSKRIFGETVAQVSSIEPSWFCSAFNKYRDNEDKLEFDQHQLVALIAPRKVYIASAEEDSWADPIGEFLSAYHASPVYELYGLSGISSNKMPNIHEPIIYDIGYHIRSGKHDVTDYDWTCFMDFTDKHFFNK
jgi:hypothetical protein